jgi:hypothetical protein
MITTLIGIFAELLQEIFAAGEDADKQQDALMAAEEKLAMARAKAKFG